MPVFLAALLGGFVQLIGTFVGRVLVSLGMGYVVYSGLDAGLSWVTAQIASSMGSIGTVAVGVLGAAGVGTAINIVLSAISIRMLFDGVTSGSVRKLVVK